MKNESHPAASLFTQVDASATQGSNKSVASSEQVLVEQTQLLREMLAAQDRQNELLEELISQIGGPMRQRAAELNLWKQNNPLLAKRCRIATEVLGKAQSEFLESLTHEISENAEDLLDNEFVMNEFVDRFGPRLAHLNGVLQVLSQLGASPSPAED